MTGDHDSAVDDEDGVAGRSLQQRSGVMELGELRAWLYLLETPQVGRESARRLLAAFGSPQAVLAADTAARRAVVGPTQAAALAQRLPEIDALVDLTLAWLEAGTAGAPRRIVTVGDAFYPASLLNAADPPLLLYVLGRVELLSAPSLIAIVGSRNPTPQGSANARAFGQHLAQAGMVVVSGMALGIDTAAHEGALLERADAGTTIAVVGTGLDRVYPKRNLTLARRIAEAGAIVSEFAIGTPPLPQHFPMRNRIIAGLAEGTLVVEATLRSGSLGTARLALEANREVFAIPGSIHSPQARGCHALIRQGAKLVESAQDILEELRPATSPRASPARDAEADPAEPVDSLLQALGHDPASLDALAARTGRSAAELSVRLLELEIDGQVARLPGQLFQRMAEDQGSS